jgi:hypothetical protein
VILWLQTDAKRTGVAAIQDWGLFVWLAWPIVIPWYALKTRGRAGWRLAFRLFGLILSAHLSWLFVAWLMYGLQYAVWYFRTGA